MRVLVVHNAYQVPGGEDVAATSEVELLRAAGHQVKLVGASNDTITGPVEAVRAFARTPFDPARLNWMKRHVAAHRAEIVHIHNFFPLLTPAIHQAAWAAGAAVVQTLHNYRPLCANGQFLRQGRICEKCLDGNRIWGLVHRCYRGSLPGSLAVLRMQDRAFAAGTWTQHVHRFIAPSRFTRDKYISAGFPAERVVVKSNFVSHSWTIGSKAGPRHGALFVGRLTPEKGVEVLLRAWRCLPDVPLTIVGEGPERARLESLATPHVRFLGALKRDGVRAEMMKAACLVFPSIWNEVQGLVVLEALSVGLPVVASALGGATELIENGRTGVLVSPGDPSALSGAVRRLLSDSQRLDEMGKRAARIAEAQFTPERNVAALVGVYQEAIEAAQGERWHG